MQYIEILNFLGLNLDPNPNPLVLVISAILFFSLLILLSVVNISIYLLSLYVLDNKLTFLNKYITKYPIIKRILIYYRNSKILFIIIEFFILVLSNLAIISICYRILTIK
jgi:hypothetical protein